MYNSTYMKEYRKKRYERGLCLHCKEARVGESIFCQLHLDEQRERSAKNRNTAASRGMCKRCHQEKSKAGKSYCSTCLKSERLRRGKERDAKLKAGLCSIPKCTNKHVEGKTACEIHLKKDVKRNAAMRQARIEAGLCRDCNRVKLPHCMTCEICVYKNIARCNFGTTSRWRELKELFELQSACRWTGRKLTIGLDASLNHVIPTARGGDDSLENLEWVYRSKGGVYDVNRMLGHMLPEEYEEAIKEQYETLMKRKQQ